MIRITGSGQTIGPGPIAILDLYLDPTREALGQLFRRRAITNDGRRLTIAGDLKTLAGTAYTKATIEYRFLGDCIIYYVRGSIAPGPRAWVGIVLAASVLIAETLMLPGPTEINLASAIAKWFGLAATAWYLATFASYAFYTRRMLLAKVREVCAALEHHE